MEDNNIMELRSIPDLMDKQFFIPEYQRGYRWESSQVKQLLDDLFCYFEDDKDNSSFYCLQPIVVKKCDVNTIQENNLKIDGKEEWYEVIDGQQRLTTIRILCAIFDSMDGRPGRHSFEIRYATRPDMDGIYRTIKAVYDPNSNKYERHIDGDTWANLDSVYIYNAAQTSIDWFNEQDRRKSCFGSNFFNYENEKKSVQVVWYEDCGGKDARDIFNEINDLTVKLSCSELIRSLFLSTSAKYKCSYCLDNIKDKGIQEMLINADKKNQQRYINTKWDEIEHKLSESRVQAFITNTKPAELRNSIELLFDLISKKNVNSEASSPKKDPLYTFIYFNNEMKGGNASDMWKVIEEYFSRICGWMEDRNAYHMIGYLNSLEEDDSVICDLLAFAKDHSHKELDEELIRRIKNSVKCPKNTKNLSELSYENPVHYDYIRKLLFLYNVELNRRMKTREFFPFELFKPLKSHWTLEHIHAQNSERLEKKTDVWIEWAKDNIATIRTLHLNGNLNEEAQKVIADLEVCIKKVDNKEYGYHEVTQLFNDVFELYSKISEQHTGSSVKSVHQLSNMALLNQSVNSAIGCSVFAVKRQNIIRLRNNGEFFPMGTLNVFQKAYSKNPYLNEWSYEDRRSYMASLKWILKSYISNDVML